MTGEGVPPGVAVRVIEELRRSARPLDDGELAARLGLPQRQSANQACRALASAGRIRRYRGATGKLVNELVNELAAEPSPTTTATTDGGDPAGPHAGDSSTQRGAETVMLTLLGERLGVDLAPRRFEMPGGSRVEIDGADEQQSILVEAWAHQGPPKAAQKNKIMADALRLLFVARTLPSTPRLILCLSDPAAAHPFTTARSWAAAALREFNISVEVVCLPEPLRAAILAAQARQYR